MSSKGQNLFQKKEINADRERFVRLRKQRMPLEKISDKVNLKTHYVMKILKEELGDEYDNYNLIQKRSFTRSEINKIVRLRKDYLGIQKISERCNIPVHFITRILLKELGDEYYHYVRPNSYQNIKRRSEEKVKKIINLRSSGKSVRDIRNETGLSEHFIMRLIAEETGEDLKYGWNNYRKGIHSEIGRAHV